MIFKNSKSKLGEIIEAQAKKMKIETDVLKALYEGKSCPKYGTNEPLHVRRVRSGKLTVFNISEKYRAEKISDGRKKTQASKSLADGSANGKY